LRNFSSFANRAKRIAADHGVQAPPPAVLYLIKLRFQGLALRGGPAGWMPSRFQSKKYSTINDLLAGSVSIVIYFESALLLRGQTPSKSVNGKIPRQALLWFIPLFSIRSRKVNAKPNSTYKSRRTSTGSHQSLALMRAKKAQTPNMRR
jgi:hypothetical protein